MLPQPVRALAAELGLHRDTIALAYEQLGQAGLVEARVGAGTFVRSLLTPAEENFTLRRSGRGTRTATMSSPSIA